MAESRNTRRPWVTPWRWVVKTLTFQRSGKKAKEDVVHETPSAQNGKIFDLSGGGGGDDIGKQLKIEHSLLEIDNSATKCMRDRYPRTYAILVSVFIPLLLLIGLCFLFGFLFLLGFFQFLYKILWGRFITLFQI